MSDNINIRDNIILFPKVKKEAPEKKLSDKELKLAMEAQVRLFAQQLKDVAMDDLFGLLDKNNLNTDNVNMSKDLAFVADAIKSLIYRDFGIKHPLQMVVDNTTKVNIVAGIPTEPMVNYKNIMVKTTKKKDSPDKEIP